MEQAQELIAIDCVNALFWNYTSTDVKTLKSLYPDFSHVWDTYVADKNGQDSFNELWRCWVLKFSVSTKVGIIAYAIEKFGQEKKEDFDSALFMSQYWQRMEHGDQAR